MAKGISVHVGLNAVDPRHYGGWVGRLAACEFDAEDMKGVADLMHYQSTLLLTADATREAVINAIKDAASRLASGDIFFLTYSGHGGQVPDVNGDESDLQDETWCLYDGQLIDDELANLWSTFQAGTRIIVLSDSCHSGTATRDMVRDAVHSGQSGRFRVMPDEAAARTYRTNRVFYDDIQRNLPAKPAPVTATVRLISGCQDNQLSRDGVANGAFTGRLLAVWSGGRFDGDYADFHHKIVMGMPPDQTPNLFVFGADNPTFAGQKPFTV
jgi:hypothetical protein